MCRALYKLIITTQELVGQPIEIDASVRTIIYVTDNLVFMINKKALYSRILNHNRGAEGGISHQLIEVTNQMFFLIRIHIKSVN